eukprot:7017890-Prymnesium_polylepis.1
MSTYFLIATKLNGMYITYDSLLKAEEQDLGSNRLQIDALLAAIENLEEQRNELRKRIIATLRQEGCYNSVSRTNFYKTTLGIDDTFNPEDQAALKLEEAKKASAENKRLIDGGQDLLANMSLIDDPKSSAERTMNDLFREKIPDDDTDSLQARRAKWFAEKARQKAKEESNAENILRLSSENSRIKQGLKEIRAAIKDMQTEIKKDEAALSEKEQQNAFSLGQEDIVRAKKASLTSELEAVDAEQREANVNTIRELNKTIEDMFAKKVEIDDARASVIVKRLKVEELMRREFEAYH